MEHDTYLRVQAASIGPIELENQDGALQHHVLEVWASALFPQSHQAESQRIRLVFDKTLLAHVQEYLRALDLPPTPEKPSVSVQ